LEIFVWFFPAAYILYLPTRRKDYWRRQASITWLCDLDYKLYRQVSISW